MTPSLAFDRVAGKRLAGAGRSYAPTLVTNLANLLLGLFTGVLTARGLPPSERGELVALVVWSSSIALLSILGADEAAIRQSQGDDSRARGLRKGLLLGVVGQVVVGALILFGIALFIQRDSGAGALFVAMLISSIVPLNAVNQLCLAPLRVAGRLGAWNLLRLLPQSIYAVGVLFHVLTDSLSVMAGVSWLVGGVIATALACLAVDLRCPDRLDSSSAELDAARSFGRRLVPTNLLYQVGPRFDQLILGLAFAAANLGVYSVATAVASVVLILALTLDQLLFPRWSAESPSLATVTSLVWRSMSVAMVFALPVWLISPAAISWLYGDAYVAAWQPLGLLMAAAILRVGSSVLNAALKAEGATAHLTRANGFSLGVGCALFPLAVLNPLLGAASCALGAAVAQLLLLRRALRVARRGDPS